MTINWLGQGGFVFESNGYRLAVDPYLSDSCADHGGTRMIPPPTDARGLKPSAVFFTHDHIDHFDEEIVLLVQIGIPNDLRGLIEAPYQSIVE